MPELGMPRLSDSMEEGTILRWLKSDGDEVKRGEEIVEIETDKANMTYEADADGVLKIVAEEGATLPVGEVIAHILAPGESAPEAPAGGEPGGAEEPAQTPGANGGDPSADRGDGEPDEDGLRPGVQQAPAPSAPAEAPAEPARAPDGASDGGRVKASPVARRVAAEHDLELSRITGSGPGGRIVKADVEAVMRGDAELAAPAAPAPAAAPAPSAATAPAGTPASEGTRTAKGETTITELTRTQRLIARRMAESKATIPHFTLHMQVDMSATVAMRGQLKEALGDRGPAPSLNDFIVKAAALALREHPRVNGSYKDGAFELHERVNVGVAVATEDALVVPTVFDADRKTLGQIAADTRALSSRVRDGSITPPELSGGTFTVSNLGMFGIDNFTAIINPPQAAILTVGAVTERALVIDGSVTARPACDLTLGCDHRILYGADGAVFLRRVRELLEAPAALAL